MSEFVATYIAHGDFLSDSSATEITGKLESSLGVKSTGKTRLGKRAVDAFFQLEDVTSAKDVIMPVVKAYTDVDIIIQRNDEFRQNKGLFVFDMDSTLIYQEVIEQIASYAGVEEEVKKITDLAMNNEIDFKESLNKRVGLLQGLKIDVLYDEIKTKLEITNGVQDLVAFIKRHQSGCKFSVLSGGFIQFAEYIGSQLNFDFKKANLLEVDQDGKLTGKLLGELVDGQCKADTLIELCAIYNVERASSVMVGDGGNDLLAMGVAGFGIAWNAKSTVQEKAPCRLNTKSMKDILYILGYTDEQLMQ